MDSPFQAIKITDTVYWVGAIDWSLRDFHGYATDNGTTYNAFLILSDKITLIDTVKAQYMDEMFSRISSVISPCEIDYIVSNHAEMDHSGSLPKAIEVIKPEKVFASTRGKEALSLHFHDIAQFITPVKEGDSLSLGNMNLKFIETPMLHWPDSMFSYLIEEQILFSQDAFGMHLASSRLYNDEIDEYVLYSEAAKYFANILMPYSKLIQNLLVKFKTLNLPIKLIAPDHGPLWRSNWHKILDLYNDWSSHLKNKKAIIVYDTMWNSTEKMAKSIGDGLISSGIDTKVLSLKSNHRSNIATELLNSSALITGSPTINDNIFPTVLDALSYLKGLKKQNLTGAVFGSFGWNGKAIDLLTDYMKQMNIELPIEPIKFKYVPTAQDLLKCREFGIKIASFLN
ncbi:MAG: hypothetical protein ACD_79C01101G0004 [uncultured bacterium]|nr:MAG: hypothetical protein ACD_79C01101G0004 [uncultured bacterium]